MVSDSQALIDALMRETSPTSQSTIIEQIGARGIVAAVEPLIALARLNDYQSGPAIAALGAIGDPRAIDVLIASFERQNLAWIAKDALVRIGEPAVNPLLAVLNDIKPDVAFMAVRTLGELRDPRAIDPLSAYVAREPDATNRQSARTTLKTLLLHTLYHINSAQRLHAIQGLVQLSDARTIDALETVATTDPVPDVRTAAATAITVLVADVEHDPFEEHQPPLLSRDTRLAINTLQQRARQAIPLPGATGDPSVTLDSLQNLATNADDAIALQAQQCVRLLAADCLRNPAPAVRLIAIRGLAGFANDHALHPLIPIATHDPDPAVREAAATALAT